MCVFIKRLSCDDGLDAGVSNLETDSAGEWHPCCQAACIHRKEVKSVSTSACVITTHDLFYR